MEEKLYDIMRKTLLSAFHPEVFDEAIKEAGFASVGLANDCYYR